jgi:single-strand DNA-binding protein
MLNFSQATIVGYLARDPEVRHTQSGAQVTRATVAVTHWAPEGLDKLTSYFDVVAFGTRGRFLAEHTRKGDAVMVVGELRIETWQKDDGTTGRAPKIIADRTLGLAPQDRRSHQPAAAHMVRGPGNEDDLPF